MKQLLGLRQFVDGSLTALQKKDRTNGQLILLKHHHSEYLKASKMSTKIVVGRIDSSLNENLWMNLNRDLDDMATLVGEDIEKGWCLKVGDTVLRVYVPNIGMYADFIKRNYNVAKNARAWGRCRCFCA